MLMASFYNSETADLNKSKYSCKFELTCRNTCQRIRTINRLFCQCDTLCWFYGDCCADYYPRCLGVELTAPELEIIEALTAQLNSYYDFLRFSEAIMWRRLSSCQRVNGNSLQMVRACSREPAVQSKFARLHSKLNQAANTSEFVGISYKETIDQCENLSVKANTSILPVSLNKDYIIHFYNVFCAICNGVDPGAVVAWSLAIEKNNTNFITNNKERKDKISVFTTLGWRWCIQYENHQQQETNTAAHILGHVISNETKYNTCTSEELSENRLCQRYQRPYVIGENGEMLKNSHCTLCTEAQDVVSCSTKQCYCPETYYQYNNFVMKPLPEKPEIDILPNFKLLFYFRDQKITKSVTEQMAVNETKVCPENQVFAPFYDRCVDALCPEEWNMFNSQCFGDSVCPSQQNKIIEDSMSFMRGSQTVFLAFVFHRVIDESVGNVPSTNKSSSKNHTDEKSDLKSFEELRMYVDSAIHLNTPINDTHSILHTFTTNQNSIIDYYTSKSSLEIDSEEIDKSNLLFMKSIWSIQIARRGIWNYTELLSNLLKSMHNIIDNMTTLEDWQYFIKDKESCQLITRQENGSNTRGKLCITVAFVFNDTKDTDEIISRAERELIPNVMVSAQRNNFILEEVRMTNIELFDKVDEKKANFDEAELCGNGRRPKDMAVNVTVIDNGTYMVKFNDASSLFPINRFGFSLNFLVEEITEVVHLAETADIIVCASNISISNCSIVFYHSSNILLYWDHLLVTKHVEQLALFLSNFKAPNDSQLPDLLKLFSEKYSLSIIETYERGKYALITSGAYVCSNYSKTYNASNVTTATHLYSFIPSQSLSEQIASMIASLVSVTCLVMVLAVYTLVKELRNTPGKIVMSKSGALLLAQVMFLCSKYPQGILCQIYAAVQHAALLSSFAWLAAMAVHLTFVLCRQSNGDSRFTICILSALCWGLPCLLAGCCFSLDELGIADMKYGANGQCWFGNATAMLIAFGLPLFLLVSTTIISAIFIIHAIQKSSAFIKKAAHDSHRARSQLLLCVNISILMGLNWVVYLIAVAVETPAIWVLYILTNGSQGVFVFTCYVAKKSVMRKLVRRWHHHKVLTDSKWGSTSTKTQK